MTVDEEQVFQSIRMALEARGWSILAGQAARGSTDLPVVQARVGTTKGSKGAFKPDLVVSKAGYLLVLELKPRFSQADVAKCATLANCDRLVDSLLVDLSSRRRWPTDRVGRPQRPTQFLTGVAYQGLPVQLQQSVCFAMSSTVGNWTTLMPSAVPIDSSLIISLSI